MTGPHAHTVVNEILPKSGLVYSEKGNLSEVLCKPKLMALKSRALKALEEAEQNAAGAQGAGGGAAKKTGTTSGFNLRGNRGNTGRVATAAGLVQGTAVPGITTPGAADGVSISGGGNLNQGSSMGSSNDMATGFKIDSSDGFGGSNNGGSNEPEFDQETGELLRKDDNRIKLDNQGNPIINSNDSNGRSPNSNNISPGGRSPLGGQYNDNDGSPDSIPGWGNNRDHFGNGGNMGGSSSNGRGGGSGGGADVMSFD